MQTQREIKARTREQARLRQAALRERREQAGQTEVRGIYASESDHARIKAFARSLPSAAEPLDKPPNCV